MDVIANPDPAIMVFLVLALILIVGGLIVMLTFRFNPYTRLSLALSGVPVQARVISSVFVGLNVTESQIRLMDVELELGGDFAGQRVKKRLVEPRRSPLMNGTTITVIVHPRKPSRFRVDWKSAHSHIDKLMQGDLSALMGGQVIPRQDLQGLAASLGAQAPAAHPQAGYPQAAYPQAAYPQAGYPQAAHPQAGYPQAAYPPAAHPQASPPANDRIAQLERLQALRQQGALSEAEFTAMKNDLMNG